MAPRVTSHETVVRFAGRAAALVLLLALGSGWSSADPWIPLGGEVARQVNLLKPPNEDLRIRWSAAVHDEGGEFLVTRQAFGGTSAEVTRVRPRRDGRYEVVEPSSAGSWIYKLRYRDRRGQEHVLVTIHLNVQRLEPGPPTLTGGADGQPVALRTAAVLPTPGACAVTSPTWEGNAHGGPGRWPPTPPP